MCGWQMKTHEEIKRDAQALREVSIEDLIDFTHVVHSMFPQAADLVESLLTEIEKVECERDAREDRVVELCKIAGRLERERDALLNETKGFCTSCAYDKDCHKRGNVISANSPPRLLHLGTCEHWKWRGVQEVE